VLRGIKITLWYLLRMDAYEIAEIDGGYAVLAHGRPQILFKSRQEAEAALKQILDLGEFVSWHQVLRSVGVRIKPR